MKQHRIKKILPITGEISRILRYVVGGKEFTLGREVRPVSIEEAGIYIQRLRELLDKYDEQIMESLDDEDLKNSKAVEE